MFKKKRSRSRSEFISYSTRMGPRVHSDIGHSSTTVPRLPVWMQGCQDVRVSATPGGIFVCVSCPRFVCVCMKVTQPLKVYLRSGSLVSCSLCSLFLQNGNFREKMKFFLPLSLNDCEEEKEWGKQGRLIVVTLMLTKQLAVEVEGAAVSFVLSLKLIFKLYTFGQHVCLLYRSTLPLSSYMIYGCFKLQIKCRQLYSFKTLCNIYVLDICIRCERITSVLYCSDNNFYKTIYYSYY